MTTLMRAAVMASSAVCLLACRSLPPASADWPARQSALAGLQEFRLDGRVAVLQGGESRSAGLIWRQRRERAELSLRAPLGMGAIELESDGAEIRLRGAPPGSGADIAGQLRALLGFEPPVQQMRYWLIGLPAMGTIDAQMLDEQQRLSQLEQAGWTVRYLQYRALGRFWLPTHLQLSRAGVRLNLLIAHWQLS